MLVSCLEIALGALYDAAEPSKGYPLKGWATYLWGAQRMFLGVVLGSLPFGRRAFQGWLCGIFARDSRAIGVRLEPQE